MDSELRNTSYDSVQDDFCSPTKSSVEGSLHYLQQVIRTVQKSYNSEQVNYILHYLHPPTGTPDVRPAISIK